MKIGLGWWLVRNFALAASLGVAFPVWAVPAWARKTGLPCASCHFGGTSRLNAVGRNFQIRGHRLPGDPGPGNGKGLNVMGHLSLKLRYRDSDAPGAASDPAFIREVFSLFAGGPLTPGLSYFSQYDVGEKSGRSPGKSWFREANVQYNSSLEGGNYGWARVGQITPYAIYAAGGSGRATLSHPRVISDALAPGHPYAPRHRLFGASAGYVTDNGFRMEGGVLKGDSGGGGRFLTIEKDMDETGSGVGVYGYRGRSKFSGALSWEDRYTRLGLLGQFVQEVFKISGAWFTGQSRLFDGASPPQRVLSGGSAEPAACSNRVRPLRSNG